uniref:Uncharacterized protein n=1 Tax=viral metagenome TaxID=1070528 RepID=A0A6C0LDD0_9ZZZZ
MEDLIYSVSLLFGILIVLLIIIYYDLLININKNKDKSKEDDDDETIIEKYCDSGGACGGCRASGADDNLKEQDMPAKNIIMTSEDIKVGDENYKHIIYEKDIVDKYKIASFLKSPSLKMAISSFEKEANRANIEHFQWTKDNDNRDFIVSIDDSPKIHRFPFNPSIYGYNLSNITVEIDNLRNSKDNSENAIINELAVFFNLKLNDIKGSVGEGQLICINSYDYQNIYIKIIEKNKPRCYEGESINIDDNYGTLNDMQDSYSSNNKKTYDIVLDINSNKYYIRDISEDILRDPVIFMGLVINKDRIVFYINKEMAIFERLDDKLIIIDYPIYINKNKECDITLYSAALIINSNNIHGDMEKYELYNKYNLYDKINI